MSHLLVTNDFPPRVGGIQSYCYELWRRLPPEQTTVLTTACENSARWDAEQLFRIERVDESFLAPTPKTINRINRVADQVGAKLVLLDPAWPLGAIGPNLEKPYGVVLHGAEVTIPARLPFVQLALRRTLRRAALVIAAGGYPACQADVAAGRALGSIIVSPGVDTERFRVFTDEQRSTARTAFGIEPEATVILGLSRLVPRKGFDVLLQAAARLAGTVPDLLVVIAGEGRDRRRLEGLAGSLCAPAKFLGAVEADMLPAIYGCADLFAMICRDRWFGLEQEGFGIVFLEAASSGLPSVAGRSGGSCEAVLENVTGLVIEDPSDVDDVENALGQLLSDRGRRAKLGAAAFERARAEFSYDELALKLSGAIEGAIAPRSPRSDSTS